MGFFRRLTRLPSPTRFGFSSTSKQVTEGVDASKQIVIVTGLAYAWNGPFGRAVELYQRMLDTGIELNKFTFPFVLKACSALEALADGILIHEHAKKAGLELDVFVSTALLDMYLKCGWLEDAHEVFCRMPQKDVVAWNALVSGYALNGRYQEAVRCLLQMQRTGNISNPSTIVALLPIVGQAKALIQGKSIHAVCIRRRVDKGDVLVNTALLDMYGKFECLVRARRIFDSMSFRNEVAGWRRHCKFSEVVGLELKLQGLWPSEEHMSSLEQGTWKLPM
ncbi:hypothetical protein ZIOFF_040471 [Zingiber officinale]|uniref:Pentatricopeptide repeat-containing protein n=1 Tax=Zingiber officinale TaxID=94328 RepID=A0A8J5GFM5_ZINOF|nr:hypothetical protein ZIOFF_040471 [Zingiber officinale]